MQTKIEELIHQEPVNFEGYFWGGFLAIQRRNNHDAVRLLHQAGARDAKFLCTQATSYFLLLIRPISVVHGDYGEGHAEQNRMTLLLTITQGGCSVSTDAEDFAQAAGYLNQALNRNAEPLFVVVLPGVAAG